MYKAQDFLIDSEGNAVSGATVTVRVANATPHTGVVAAIYSDDGITLRANPTSTASDGYWFFYAADGSYDIEFEYGTSTAELTNYKIADVDSSTSTDTNWSVKDLDVTTEFQLPTAAPGSPAAGDLWEASGVLKHGASSKTVADLETEQTFTQAQTVNAPASAGKVALTVKGDATANADVLDIYDSAGSPAKQSWFDSGGTLGTNKNLTFKSGTSNTLTLDHGITADRTIVFPDTSATLATTATPGTSGSDVNWSATGTLNVPDAGAATRGVVSTGSQTLAGQKTFSGGIISPDATTVLQDNSDATKQMQFQLSGITTGNTRTITVPDASGTMAMTDTTQTFSGTETFTGTVSTKNLNKVLYADQYAGADASAKINAAIADLPATGGIVDASGLTGAQTISTTVTVGSSTKPVTLKLSPAATFSGTVDPLFKLNKSSTIAAEPGTILKATSTNTVLEISEGVYDSTYNAFLTGFPKLDGNSTSVRVVKINNVGNVGLQAWVTGGLKAGISLAGGGTQDVYIEGRVSQNVGAGLYFETTGGGHNVINITCQVANNTGGGIIVDGYSRSFTIRGDIADNGSFGTVSTNGTAVTWASGSTFNTNWPAASNNYIKINGVIYGIASINSTTSITLASSAGVQAGVTYGYGPEMSLQALDGADIDVYVESVIPNNAEYVGIQCDAMTFGTCRALNIRGNFFQTHVLGVGTAISTVGKNAQPLSGTIGPVYVYGFANGIVLGAAGAGAAVGFTILPSTFETTTTPISVAATGRYTRFQQGALNLVGSASNWTLGTQNSPASLFLYDNTRNRVLLNENSTNVYTTGAANAHHQFANSAGTLRFQVQGDTDEIKFGASADTNLKRASAGVLETNGDLRIDRTTDTDVVLTLDSGSTARQDAYIDFQDRGTSKWQTGIAASPASYYLYDGTRNRLRLDEAGDNVQAVGAAAKIHYFTTHDGNEYVTIDPVNNSILFGNLQDTNLYRSTANTLKTDDALVVAGATTLQSTLSYRNLTETVTSANSIAASESGSVFFLNSGSEFDSILPAPAAGLRFTFIITGAPSGASYTITTNGGANIIRGQVFTVDVNSATDPDFETSGVDVITFVDGKSVGGDRVDLFCDGTGWYAYAFCSVFDAITFS